MSSYVTRFEARGHVIREPNPDDRRSYRIQLTPAETLLRLRTVVDGIRHGGAHTDTWLGEAPTARSKGGIR